VWDHAASPYELNNDQFDYGFRRLLLRVAEVKVEIDDDMSRLGLAQLKQVFQDRCA
jgi:hypothetical protein